MLWQRLGLGKAEAVTALAFSVVVDPVARPIFLGVHAIEVVYACLSWWVALLFHVVDDNYSHEQIIEDTQ